VKNEPHSRHQPTDTCVARQVYANIECSVHRGVHGPCLTFNAETSTYDYQLHRCNPGEWIITTTHAELSLPIRVNVKAAVIHGIEHMVLARQFLCINGIRLATDWSWSYIRNNGAYLPGRVDSKFRRIRSVRPNRRRPLPIVVNAAIFYAAVLEWTEPLPQANATFARLLAIVHRRFNLGEDLGALLEAYGIDPRCDCERRRGRRR